VIMVEVADKPTNNPLAPIPSPNTLYSTFSSTLSLTFSITFYILSLYLSLSLSSYLFSRYILLMAGCWLGLLACLLVFAFGVYCYEG